MTTIHSDDIFISMRLVLLIPTMYHTGVSNSVKANSQKSFVGHPTICSMCIKIKKVGKQEVGIWWIQKCFPRYGVPIWSWWPNIRSLPLIVTEKNATKNGHIQNVYKNQLSRQTGSRNLTGQKTLPTIWHTYMKLVTKYQIPVINSCLEKCAEKCAYTN